MNDGLISFDWRSDSEETQSGPGITGVTMLVIISCYVVFISYVRKYIQIITCCFLISIKHELTLILNWIKSVLHSFTRSPISAFRFSALPHWGRLTSINVRALGHYLFRKWICAYLAPSHFFNHWCPTVKWTPRNLFPWIFNHNKFLSKMHFQMSSLERHHFVSVPTCKPI